jgi:diguanylate cyclase (GGDEF)-like protein
VSHDATHNQLSQYANDIDQGFFAGLSFPAHLEGKFRKFYSHAGVSRARLMPCFAIMMTLIAAVMRLSGDGPWVLMTLWDVCVFLPLLVVTLYTSTLPDQYRIYQKLLALSGLLSGLVVSSMYFRPGLEGMPSYFTMEVAWILAVWLILGLRFLPAAAAAIIISCAHIVGILFLGYEVKVLGYEIVMLFLINGIGATCCYQIEHTIRRSFIESLELEEMTRELTALAELDGLTGLNNRRTYDAYIDRLWRQARREQTALTIILVDIDHFKIYNDHYGHQSGDNALKAVADVIDAHAKRPLDFAARYGGEEFVLALSGSHLEQGSQAEDEVAYSYAEKLRRAVRALQIPHSESTTDDCLTVSVGVAVILPGTRRSLAGAVQMADEALYQAKEEGRNRVVVAKSSGHEFSTGRFRTGQFRAKKTTAA